jgi:hypothetical protein
MQTISYNLCKIAENNKLIIEILESKIELNNKQQENFCNLINNTQKLMYTTTIDYLTFKNKNKDLEKITIKPYQNNVVSIVRKSLLEIRKESNFIFNKKYINYIEFNNH